MNVSVADMNRDKMQSCAKSSLAFVYSDPVDKFSLCTNDIQDKLDDEETPTARVRKN